MNKKHLLTGVCVFFLLAGSASGLLAAEAPADLKSLLLLGLQENLGLQAEHVNIPVSRLAVTGEEGRFDIEVFADAGYSRQRVPNTTSFIPQDVFDGKALSGAMGLRKQFSSGLSAEVKFNTGQLDDSSVIESLDPKYHSSLGLEFIQPLLQGAGTDANLARLSLAQGRSHQSDLAFLQQAQNLALAIEVGYYELLKARRVEQYNAEALALTDTLLQVNRRKLNAGLIPVSEVQEAETAYAGRELNYILAQQQREVQAHRLDGLLDNQLPAALATAAVENTELTAFSAPERTNLPTLQSALQAAEASRPDLQIALIAVDNSLLSEYADKNRSLPRLDLSVQVQANGVAGAEQGTAMSPYAGSWADSVTSLADGDGYQWGVGLQFTYPLGNRSAKAVFHSSELLTRQSRLARQSLRSQVETELRERLTQANRLGQLVAISSRFQELAEISLGQESKRLAEGLSDTFRVLTFQEKMITAKINRVTALAEYNKSLASLSYAMGSNLMRHGIVTNLSAKELRFDEN